MPPDFHLITQQPELEELTTHLRNVGTIALDTEADSLHSYRQKVCLIQIGAGDGIWLIDTLADLDVTPLLEVLAQRPLLLHGADYDLRMLHHDYGFEPDRVFDTMIAAQLLGREHLGLAALVLHYCEVELPKSGQRADWSARPIPEQLLRYAADDVRYLPVVQERLRAELIQHDRLAWHEETCQRLLSETRVPREVAPDPWRIKGGRHFTGRAAAVLRELWRWRDRIAERLNRPGFKVANNPFLIQWAQWIDAHPDATFDDAPERPAWLRGARRESFEEALATALTLPKSAWPHRTRPTQNRLRMSDPQKKRLDALIATRDRVAAQIKIEPGILAPRDKLIQTICEENRPSDFKDAAPPLMNWQREHLALDRDDPPSS